MQNSNIPQSSNTIPNPLPTQSATTQKPLIEELVENHNDEGQIITMNSKDSHNSNAPAQGALIPLKEVLGNQDIIHIIAAVEPAMDSIVIHPPLI